MIINNHLFHVVSCLINATDAAQSAILWDACMDPGTMPERLEVLEKWIATAQEGIADYRAERAVATIAKEPEPVS